MQDRAELAEWFAGVAADAKGHFLIARCTTEKQAREFARRCSTAEELYVLSPKEDG